MADPIYWAVENNYDGYYLHGFKTLEERSAWLQETNGITLNSVGGRGFPDELGKDNPFRNDYNKPIIWH